MAGTNEAGAPPISNPVIDESGVASMPWIQFFNNLYIGDRGRDWVPNFVNLTQVGAPTIRGRYYMISKSLAYFRITITPGTSTSAVAGSTYIDNFPRVINGDGACHAVSGLLGSNAGMIDASSRRIYVPTWTGVTVPLSVTGTVEVR